MRGRPLLGDNLDPTFTPTGSISQYLFLNVLNEVWPHNFTIVTDPDLKKIVSEKKLENPNSGETSNVLALFLETVHITFSVSEFE